MTGISIRRWGAELTATMLSWVRCRTFSHPSYLRYVPESAVRRFRLRPPPRGHRRSRSGRATDPDGFVHVTLRGSRTSRSCPTAWIFHSRTGGGSRSCRSHARACATPPDKGRAGGVASSLDEWRWPGDPCPERGGSRRRDSATGRQQGSVGLSRAPCSAMVLARRSGRQRRSTGSPDHKVLWTYPLLASFLSEAGFEDVRDVSSRGSCHHAQYWHDELPTLCLEILAKRPKSSTPQFLERSR